MAAINRIGTNRLATLLPGQLNNNFVRAVEFNALVDRVNSFGTADGTISLSGNQTLTGNLAVTGTTTLTGSLTATAATFSGVVLANSYFAFSKANIANRGAGIAINTTGAGTLAVVTSGVLAGLITSTSASGVTVTMDSVANLLTAAAAVGVTLGAGSNIQFMIDNSGGANTVTLAVDSGATIAVATPAITGGATLTVSTANKVGLFNLYLTSVTAGTLSRIV